MRLINVKTLKFEEFFAKLPEYAILSHTWRDSEVIHAEFYTVEGRRKDGFRKVIYLCDQAKVDRFKYAWIDTACIDKTSSAELSEAINSMYKWYRQAKVCYVYLDDVEDISGIGKSHWATRGWTLQELLAPTNVKFYSRDWKFLGEKSTMLQSLAEITKINQSALQFFIPGELSVAMTMSWAADRNTTRVEDTAYCLMGLFDVHMPIIYGEGHKAFQRLQEEILKRWNDFSILVWNRPSMRLPQPLAHNPYGFKMKQKATVRCNNQSRIEYHSIIALSLQATLPLLIKRNTEVETITPAVLEGFINGTRVPDTWALLNCRYQSCLDGYLGLGLYHMKNDEYWISPQYAVISMSQAKLASSRSIFLSSAAQANRFHSSTAQANGFFSSRSMDMFLTSLMISVKWEWLLHRGFEIIHPEPENAIGSWDPSTCTSEPLISASRMLRKFGFLHPKNHEAFVVTVFLDSGAYAWDHFCAIKVEAKPESLKPFLWLKEKGILDSKTKQPTSGEAREWQLIAKRIDGEVEFVTRPLSGLHFSSVTVTVKTENIMEANVHTLTVFGG